jgi:hypothetical protein
MGACSAARELPATVGLLASNRTRAPAGRVPAGLINVMNRPGLPSARTAARRSTRSDTPVRVTADDTSASAESFVILTLELPQES